METRIEAHENTFVRNLIVCVAALWFAIALPVHAQDDSDDSEIEETTAESEEDAAEEEAEQYEADGEEEVVVVTGSLLKRDTYTSVSPLQVITAEVSREAGLIDPADILQESTASSGEQIDLTFTGFVLDNGPQASTVNLRGLSAGRTLVLINGRRLAPAGVEGAPSSPDLNLIPGTLVQQYELLLEGASSIYGSDAVAGVANVILQKEFDGVEVDYFGSRSLHGGIPGGAFTMKWGRNYDRGFVGMAGSYEFEKEITLEDVPWYSGCTRHAEVDENGNLRQREVFYSDVYGMRWDDCQLGSLARRVSVPSAGSIYYTPGSTNGGWPNFSESSIYGFGVDGDGDGEADVSFREHDLNGRENFRYLYPRFTRRNFMAYGEYTFEGNWNVTPFFEVLWGERQGKSNAGQYQFFPEVPAQNPYNICNPAAENGVDCGLAWDALILNPNVYPRVLQFLEEVYGWSGGFADFVVNNFILSGPIGPATSLPIVAVKADRSERKITVNQLRSVGGVTASLPFMDSVFTLRDWSGELSVTYTESVGISKGEGIREDRLNFALGVHSSTNTPCENDLGVELDSDVTDGCVPVNMFAPSLYPANVIGDFETPEERAYLFDTRDFDTRITQTLVSGLATGGLFGLPAGEVMAGVGVEFREDKIESIPGKVARDGLWFGFSVDRGATGGKTTQEIFGEIEVPLLGGQLLAEELTVNMSRRRTDDEFSGIGITYAGKVGWRPFTSLLLRYTVGTSFRAPNLRELFLEGQTGFLSLFDPCLIPFQALGPNGEYLEDQDQRDAELLEKCVRTGVDPTTASNNGFNVYSMEIQSGGALDLLSETSKSVTRGVVWEQPFTNAFDLSMGVNYYKISVDDTIVEPSAGFIIYDCYQSDTVDSVFCSRIQRNATTQLIDLIHAGFINRDNETVRGVDFNVSFTRAWTIMDRPVLTSVDLVSHRLLHRHTLLTNTQGVRDETYYQGWFGYPRWRHQLSTAVSVHDFRFRLSSSYTGSMSQSEAGVDPFSNGITGFADACYGPPTDVLCRDNGHGDRVFYHSLSGIWQPRDFGGGKWSFSFGIRNLLDQQPPIVDGNEVFSEANNPYFGYGYTLRVGRQAFLGVVYDFSG